MFAIHPLAIRILITLLLIGFAPRAGAQTTRPDDPGPHSAGWQNVGFQDQKFNEGWISGRVYYPALTAGENAAVDLSAGPYPQVAFLHGYLGAPSDYDHIGEHLASWGFIVSSIGTQTGLFAKERKFARETKSLLHWVKDQSDTPGAWLELMIDDEDWSAVGHSMGARTLPLLTYYESRVTAFTALQPGAGDTFTHDRMAEFTGDTLFLAGTDDDVNPPSEVRRWYEDRLFPPRNHYLLVTGMDHSGATDGPWGTGSMPGAEQQRVTRLLCTAFLQAVMQGLDDNYTYILGDDAVAEDIAPETFGVEPIVWAGTAEVGATELRVGTAGWPRVRMQLGWSLGLQSTQTSWGILELDLTQGAVFHDAPLPAPGHLSLNLPIDSAWSGSSIYMQGLLRQDPQGAFSRRMDRIIP